jgi:acetylornithine/succinyldiaminopimelate/putrescine aminotransferase
MACSLNHTTAPSCSSINLLLAQRLELLKLYKSHYQAEGAYLYYQHTDKEEARVPGFVGGYGAVLLGHHPPEWVQAVTQTQQPAFTQLSNLRSTVHCAEWLQKTLQLATQQDCPVVCAHLYPGKIPSPDT